MCEWVGDVGGSGAILYGFILYRFCEQRSTTLGYTPPHSRAVSTYINPYITPLPRSASLLGIDGVHERDQAAVAIRRGESHRAQPRRRPQRGVQRGVLGGADVLRRLVRDKVRVWVRVRVKGEW